MAKRLSPLAFLLLGCGLWACADAPTEPPPTGPFDIAFTRESANAPPEVWVMRSDGSNQKQVTVNGVASRPRLSPDGSQIVFESQGTELDILDLTTGGRRKLADGVPCCAQWSPDGKRIAFTNRPAAYSPSEVFVVDVEGTNLRQITQGQNFTPSGFTKFVDAWSPDGKTLLLTALFDTDPNPTTALYVMSEASAAMTALTDTAKGGVGIAADWSPDGSTIAFTADGGYIGASTLRYHGVIYTMSLDGSARVQLSADTGHDTGPSWSPDGKQIVFSSDRDGHSQIYVMNADGTSQHRLVTSSTTDRYPSWRRH